MCHFGHSKYMQNYLSFTPIGIFTPVSIVITITLLFIIQTIVQYRIYKTKGTLSHGYPVNTFLMFAPLYEEIIFRGVLFFELISVFGLVGSAIINAILFGVWHIRSVFFMSPKKVTTQVLYTMFIIAPICLYTTYITGNIWLAVIIHYINNILAPVCEEWHIFKK